MIHYPIPPHAQAAYRSLGIEAGSLPIAERLPVQALSLPIGPTMSDADMDRVVQAVRFAVAHR
jgi:dTDP-4-amino-4,6-dideoxygalactose transaminase